MPVLDHLRELRRRLIIIMLIVAAGAIVGWFLYEPILDILRQHYSAVPEQYRYTPNGPLECVLIYHGVQDGSTTRLKLCGLSGIVRGRPLCPCQTFAFIT